MPKLFDMGRAPIKESLKPKNVGQEKPDPYNYAHRVTLNSEDMGKLGITDPQVGDVFHVMAEGHVMSTNQSEGENGKKAHEVHVQLKKMSAKKSGGGKSMLDAVSSGVSEAQEGE